MHWYPIFAPLPYPKWDKTAVSQHLCFLVCPKAPWGAPGGLTGTKTCLCFQAPSALWECGLALGMFGLPSAKQNMGQGGERWSSSNLGGTKWPCGGQTDNLSYRDAMAATALNPFPFSRACHKQKHTNVVFKSFVVCLGFFPFRY